MSQRRGSQFRRRDPIAERRSGHHQEVDQAEGDEGLGDAGRSRADHVDALGQTPGKPSKIVAAHRHDFDHFAADAREPPTCFGDDLHRSRRTQIVRRPEEDIDQRRLERRPQHRAAAEAHDREPRGHALAVGADQRAHGRDVAKPEAAAADDAVAEIQQPQLAAEDADAADQEAAAPTPRRQETDNARPHPLQPLAGECREAQNDDRHGEHPHDIAQRPIVGRACDHADVLAEGRVEDAPGVDRTDAQVDAESRRNDQPAAEAGPRHDALLGEETRRCVPGGFRNRHRNAPSGERALSISTSPSPCTSRPASSAVRPDRDRGAAA